MHIFVHVAQIGRWQEILEEQLNLITSSGLKASISLGVLGNIPLENTVYQSDNLKEWEFPTLQKLYEHCQTHDELVLYIHGKGSSEYKKCVEDWRHYLQYFLIEKYEDCIRALEDYDICGCDWTGSHFFGNFWWARSDYIRKLKTPYDIASIIDTPNRPWNNQQVVVVHSEEKGYHYFDEQKFYARHYRLFAEMWIGSYKDVKVKELHKSKTMHLAEEYPKSFYGLKLC